MQPGTEDQQPAKESLSAAVERVIGGSLKALAVAGTLIYGALFIAYRAFYSALGIHPEDVGISHAFILSRSVGFIGLVAIVALVIPVYLGVLRLKDNVCRRVVAGIWLLLIGAYFWLLLSFEPWGALPCFIAISVPASVLAFAFRDIRRSESDDNAERINESAVGNRKRWYSGLSPMAWYSVVALTLLLTILLPAIAIAWRAHELGEDALTGGIVRPVKLAGVPILDVSTDRIRAAWICPQDQRPQVFKRFRNDVLEGTILGETSTSLFMRLQRSDSQQHHSSEHNIIVKLPQKCVMVARSEPFTDADEL